MGFRIGKRIGNSYISTNGKNIRTTTRICKNVYYTHTYDRKQKHSNNNVTNNDIGTVSSLAFLTILFSVFMCCKSFADWIIQDGNFIRIITWFCVAFIAPIIIIFIGVFSHTSKKEAISKCQLDKIEREYQAIIKMYPTFETGENHEVIINTVKKYRQYEYNKVLEAHQKEREKMYKALYECNIQKLNDSKKAIEETIKYLDENFDWLND